MMPPIDPDGIDEMYCAVRVPEGTARSMDAMRISRTMVAASVATMMLAGPVAGCGSKSAPAPAKSTAAGNAANPPGSQGSAPTSSPSSAGAQPSDYAKLLIQASDINAPVPFTASPPINNPNGQPGVATTFNTDDSSHAIHDTIQVLADPAAASNALNAAKTGQADGVKNPQSKPSNIGTGGTLVSGNTPDGSKGVAILLFTVGRALVTLEFDGPPGMLPPPEFLSDIGHKQEDAVKKGLG
jgi:hypothetical protein